MRRLAILFATFASTAQAAPSNWGFEAGLAASMGPSRFAGEASPVPPPANPGSLFALVPPTATGAQGTGLSGAAGFSLNLTWRRRLNITVEPSAAGQSLLFEENISFPSGTTLRRQSAWEWTSFRAPLLVSWAHPFWRGEGWALAPRIGGGAWYAKTLSARKLIGADGGPPAEFKWRDAPPDDWGWIACLAFDWLRLGQVKGPKRLSLELRWREGRALPEPAAGADKPARAWEAALTLPIYLTAF